MGAYSVMQVLLWLATAYLVIGVILAFVGPLRRKRQIESLTAAAANPDASRSRLTYFNLAMVIGAIVLWPIFLASVKRGPQPPEEVWARRKELRFERLGGVGQILCKQCGYSIKIVSFEHAHAESWCNTGYQCQVCGEFAAVENSAADTMAEGCKCGGALSRKEPIFCPACRSRNLDYRMEYIT